MASLTTKTYRVIDPEKVKIGRFARIIRSAGAALINGQISSISETSITIKGFLENGNTSSLIFTADQLQANDFIQFDLSDDFSQVWSGFDIDVTKDKTVDIIDIASARKDQFVQWTIDGTNYRNGIVVSVSEAALRVNTSGSSATNLSVETVEIPAFNAIFADNLTGGGDATLTVLGGN